MAIALGGLLLAADFHPVMAFAAGGFSAGLIVVLGAKTRPGVADLLAFVLSIFLLVKDRFGWTSLVLVPSLMMGSLWLRMSRKRLEWDDHWYLPGLMMALAMGILFVIRREILGSREDLFLLSGLSDVLSVLNEVMRQGVDQLAGNVRQDYLSMVEDFQAKFPYYYMGIQITALTLSMNLVLRFALQPGGARQSLFLFKIKEKYVFLLIFSLGIEIVRYLFDLKEFLYVSRSIFVLLGVTYFIAGLAVLGFLMQTRRWRTDTFLSRWIFIMIVLFILIKPVICMAIGLLDIWFDFRRLKILEGGSVA